MKIGNKEFDVSPQRENDVFNRIKEVVLPFLPQIKSKNLKLYLSKEAPINVDLIADWDMYKLVLFNVF
jgi:hypothetical protein